MARDVLVGQIEVVQGPRAEPVIDEVNIASRALKDESAAQVGGEATQRQIGVAAPRGAVDEVKVSVGKRLCPSPQASIREGCRRCLECPSDESSD